MYFILTSQSPIVFIHHKPSLVKHLLCHLRPISTNQSLYQISFVVIEDGEFEQLEITPLSSPPELPDVMKQQDSTSAHAQEQTAS